MAHRLTDFERASGPILPLHACQSLLQLAEPIFGGLHWHTLRDHTMHKGFLLRYVLLCFAGVLIG